MQKACIELLRQLQNAVHDEVMLSIIHYDSQLPDGVMQTLALQLAQYGIDITKYASLINP